jgi:hypothetical protein
MVNVFMRFSCRISLCIDSYPENFIFVHCWQSNRPRLRLGRIYASGYCKCKYNIFYIVSRNKIMSQVRLIYSVEITYGINSVISKLMTFVENAETGQFLFLIMLILSYFTCS